MNVDENEKYSREDLYFQDDETRYANDGLDTPLPDKSITNDAETNYGDTIKGGTGDQKSEDDDSDEVDEDENDNEEDNLRIDRPL